MCLSWHHSDRFNYRTVTSSSCNAIPTPFKRQLLPPIYIPPPPIPACVTQFPTLDVTKACSCIDLPTPTVTSTRTVVVSPTITITRTVGPIGNGDPVVTTSTATQTITTRACPAPPSCGNQGIEFAYYNRNAGDDFADWHPEEYKVCCQIPWLHSHNSINTNADFTT